MTNGRIPWLLDVGLPRGGYDPIDAVHVEDYTRVPGPAGIRESRSLSRCLVTCAQEFRGAWSLGIDHPGIVVLETQPFDGPEVVRNLLHLEFRLGQHDGAIGLRGNRFLVRNDRAVFRLQPDGSEVDLEPWRQVRMRLTPVRVTSTAP